MDWSWTSGIVVALVGLGVALVSVPHRPLFATAKACFVLSALLLFGKAVWWGIVTIQSQLIRIPAVGLIGAFSAVMFVEGWRWIGEAQAASPQDSTRAGIARSAAPAVPVREITENERVPVDPALSARPKRSLAREVDRAAQPGIQPKQIVGLDVSGEGQGNGNAAYEIVSHGKPGAPSIGGESIVHAQPGETAIGTRVTQSGPGIGMRVMQTGPGVGFRSVVVVGKPPEGNTQE